MRVSASLLCAAILLGSTAWSDEGHHVLTEAEVGAVSFSTSCSGILKRDFNRAVALLHSFQYAQARQAFGEISGKDPTCAMAQWGVAMSYYHGLWGNSDLAAGRAAVRQAETIAASNSRTSSRERGYIDALGEIYREDGRSNAAHAQAFEQKMGSLQAAYPGDSEAAIFHALALAITAPKSDKTFANQRRCGEILEPIFRRQPRHPGVAHYIIHCDDNPVLAERGVGAARMYAKIAPASAHANHMPSHIFTRVGSWQESIRCNLRSAELAAQAENTSSSAEARDQRLHAMDYLEYAYLQSGQIKQATALLDEMNSLVPVTGLTMIGDYALAAIPAREAIELGQWEQASHLHVRGEGVLWAQAITWAAIGVGSARSGNLERAARAEKTLAFLRDAIGKNNLYWSNQVEVQRLEVAAWRAKATNKGPDAIAMMGSAAELEERMDKESVTPGAITPAREMLAQLLLLENQPEKSLAAYQAVLRVAPNRFNALYGAASAAEASGKTRVANRYYRQLTEVSVGAERAELATARKRIGDSAQKGATTPR
jgi:tetratricopeptide (TPR) repeat protein